MWTQSTSRKSSKNKRKITIGSQYNDTLCNLLHVFVSIENLKIIPPRQGNCHLMTEPLRIYLSLYGKLPLPRGMGFSTYAEFTVTSGIYHIPRLQGLGIIFTQPAVHIYLSRPEQLQAVASGFIIYLGNDSINTWTCHLNDLC